MRREDFLQPRRLSFGKLNSAHLPPPGAPFPAAQPVPAPTVSGKTPATMSYTHHDGPHGHLLRREDGTSWQPDPRAVKGETKSESLVAADPRTNKSFWQGILDRAKRALGVE